MIVAYAFLEWAAAGTAVWFAVEASGTGSTLSILTVAVSAIVAGLARQLAFQAMRARDMDALYDRLRLAVPRGGAR
ncbi:hypothetical protein [Methylobacterium sp. SyP6R]|uniref:hypothetical protein n=1 Tax=Methylobacterium sp. SyP6R TaxID=2718876 RepID=UPI001F234F06|nr:hypothetical protein [Methylobacterium sp. SyP6R]MCF4125016.1 hypothetical protein [Methylobacterium sp. SyP6R]